MMPSSLQSLWMTKHEPDLMGNECGGKPPPHQVIGKSEPTCIDTCEVLLLIKVSPDSKLRNNPPESNQVGCCVWC